MSHCIIYTRVSTDAQEREGTSLDSQERECITYAESRGWTVDGRVSDTASGYTLERAGLEEIRHAAAGGGVDVVLSYALDRLSRKQTHVAILVEEMEDLGVNLDFVTEDFEDTAVGQLVRSVKAFASELEREKILERTTRGKVERARAGKLPQGTGKGCYGYVYDRETGRREIEPLQGAVVRRAFQEFAAGRSVGQIASALNAEGIPTLTGKRWAAATIYHVLRNETYTGRTLYRRTRTTKRRGRRVVEARDPGEQIEIEGATPALIGAELLDQCRARFADQERRRRGRRKHTYALSGRVSCRECGRAMVGQVLNKKYRYYRCRRAFSGKHPERCDSRYVRADELEQCVRQAAAEVLSNPEIVLAEMTRMAAEAPGAGRRSELEREIVSLGTQRDRVLRLFELGEIDEAALRARSGSLRAAIDSRRRESGEVDRLRPSRRPPSADELERAVAGVRNWVEGAEGDDITLLAGALQLEIAASKHGSELSGVIPEYAPDCTDADVRFLVRSAALPSE
jgi:site-specific DNA recombinase